MNLNQVNGVLRAVIPALLAYAVGRGWLGESQAADILPAILALVAAGWSVITNAELKP